MRLTPVSQVNYRDLNCLKQDKFYWGLSVNKRLGLREVA